MNAAAFAQLMLDMHRQAGVMLLDRMGDSVVQHMAAHVEVAVQVGVSHACPVILLCGDSVVQHMAAHVEVAVQVGGVTWLSSFTAVLRQCTAALEAGCRSVRFRKDD
jgi:hypothetical protein